ncbi:MAG: GNVR domain-containing protein [bacterium]
MTQEIRHPSEQAHFSVSEEELNLQETLRPLLKHRWEILLFVLLGLLVAFLYIHLTTPLYRAESTIILRINSSTNVIREREAEVKDQIRKEDFNTNMKTIKSLPLAKKLVKQMIERGYFQDDLEKVDYYNMEKQKKEEFVARKARSIKSGLMVDNPSETNMINIQYEHPDPVFAKHVVNELAELAVENNKKEQLLTTKNSLSYLNEQLDKSRKELKEAEADLYRYRQNHEIFQADMDKKLIGRQRADLSAKLTDIRAEIQELESKTSELGALKKKRNFTKYNPLIEDSRILNSLRQDLVQAEIKYEELKGTYLENHPDMKKTRRRIKVLKDKFKQELIITLERLKSKLNVLESKERYLKKSLEKMEDAAITSTEKDIEYIVMERESNSATELYRTLLSAVKEVNVNANNLANSVMFVHKTADTPPSPVKPNKPLNLMMGLVMGAMLGLAWAYGMEYMDQSVQTPDDIKKHTSLNALSTIPLLRENTDSPTPLLSRQNKKSLFVEGITGLRTHLKVHIPQEAPYSILFTSSMPQEGKTLITSNVALSFAQDGKKTIIVDGDLHHPSIHKNFGVDRENGIFDLIIQALSPDWSELDLKKLSLGDALYLIRLKEWSGTMKINWDSLPHPLTISYEQGSAIYSNIQKWRDRYADENEFPLPKDLNFQMDGSELPEVTAEQQSGNEALNFLKKYPRLSKSSFFRQAILQNYVKETEFENLDVLTAGTFTDNPAFLLGSQQMQILLQILKENYDRIIIDTPPAWPLSDVGIMSTLVDGIIWIARSGKTPRKMMQTSIQHIMEIQPNVLGVVMNAVDLKKSFYYYYGYYPYRYYKYGYYKNYLSDEEK